MTPAKRRETSRSTRLPSRGQPIRSAESARNHRVYSYLDFCRRLSEFGSRPKSARVTSKCNSNSRPGQGNRETNQSAEESFSRTVSANSFPIVGVGASAGGLEAFTELLQHLPPDTGLGFVLVQHLNPRRASSLSQILSRATSMPVRE